MDASNTDASEMDASQQQPELDSTLDAIIHGEMLPRSQVTSQTGAASPEQGADVRVRSIRIDSAHREVLRHPFADGAR